MKRLVNNLNSWQCRLAFNESLMIGYYWAGRSIFLTNLCLFHFVETSLLLYSMNFSTKTSISFVNFLFIFFLNTPSKKLYVCNSRYCLEVSFHWKKNSFRMRKQGRENKKSPISELRDINFENGNSQYYCITGWSHMGNMCSAIVFYSLTKYKTTFPSPNR